MQGGIAVGAAALTFSVASLPAFGSPPAPGLERRELPALNVTECDVDMDDGQFCIRLTQDQLVNAVAELICQGVFLVLACSVGGEIAGQVLGGDGAIWLVYDENTGLDVGLGDPPPPQYGVVPTPTTRPLEPPAPTVPPPLASPPACDSYLFNDQLPIRLCDEGYAVLMIQEALIDDGYSLEADGYFGPGTEQTIRHFQLVSGLEVDGLVGRRTWVALVGPQPGQDNNGNGIIDPDEVVGV